MGTSPSAEDPDAIYTYDPVLMTDAGAILLRPGKVGRRGEPSLAAADLEAAGVPVVAALGEPALAEGGDLTWLDRTTLLAGVGYRTNTAGVEALRDLLPDVSVVAFDLPHLAGPSACTHLLSFLSLLDADLAVASLPHLPVRLVELLHERDVRIVEVPEEEFDSMGPNVLALAPRVALALDGNPVTRARLEDAGVRSGPTPARRSLGRATAVPRASRSRSCAPDAALLRRGRRRGAGTDRPDPGRIGTARTRGRPGRRRPRSRTGTRRRSRTGGSPRRPGSRRRGRRDPHDLHGRPARGARPREVELSFPFVHDGGVVPVPTGAGTRLVVPVCVSCTNALQSGRRAHGPGRVPLAHRRRARGSRSRCPGSRAARPSWPHGRTG